MSDPRMIPADQARNLLNDASVDDWEVGPLTGDGGRYIMSDEAIIGTVHLHLVDAEPLVAAAPDLAHTVVEQAGTIQTLSRLLAGAKEAATERAAQIERVRAVLTDLRGQQKAALQRWEDTGDTWDGATSDTLHDTIHRLTEALGGDTE